MNANDSLRWIKLRPLRQRLNDDYDADDDDDDERDDEEATNKHKRATREENNDDSRCQKGFRFAITQYYYHPTIFFHSPSHFTHCYCSQQLFSIWAIRRHPRRAIMPRMVSKGPRSRPFGCLEVLLLLLFLSLLSVISLQSNGPRPTRCSLRLPEHSYHHPAHLPADSPRARAQEIPLRHNPTRLTPSKTHSN